MNNIELLDYFAGQALQGMVSSKTEETIRYNIDRQYYPKMAYLIANQMLKERENYFPTKIDVKTAKQIQ
jgi:hypothetical protein